MPIINDAEGLITVDTDTGEFLKLGDYHWHDPYMHCTISAADGSPLFAADVERIAIDETGKSGAATLVRYVLREAWFPSGRTEQRAVAHGPHPMIDRLREFLEVRRYIGGKKVPDPRFEFSDER